jgi:hypothetical protein
LDRASRLPKCGRTIPNLKKQSQQSSNLKAKVGLNALKAIDAENTIPTG